MKFLIHSCLHWQRRIRNETVDYHFMETDNEMKLIRIVESNTGYHRDSVFDYFGFRYVKPTMEEMQPPRGIILKLTSLNMRRFKTDFIKIFITFYKVYNAYRRPFRD